MKLTKNKIAILVAVIGIGIGAAVLFWNPFGLNSPQEPVARSGIDDAPDPQGNIKAEDGNLRLNVGGVSRLRSDVESILNGGRSFVSRSVSFPLKTTEQAYLKDRSTKSATNGNSPLVKADENGSVLEVANALASKSSESQVALNMFVKIPAFDRKSYDRDPSSYLAAVEPARVWQSAQPGEGVPRLQRVSQIIQNVVQGESVRIQVKTLPSSPVTFLSYDLGAFQNRLASITVPSNEQGIASADFTSVPGTVADARIVAASPVASGNQTFIVRIARQ
jgi:hypothetical protein